jgi:hypothetical protein
LHTSEGFQESGWSKVYYFLPTTPHTLLLGSPSLWELQSLTLGTFSLIFTRTILMLLILFREEPRMEKNSKPYY